MLQYQAPIHDILFNMNDVLDVKTNWQACSFSEDYLSSEVQSSILNECDRIITNEIQPVNRLGDESGLTFDQGEVKTPKGFIKAYKSWSEGGWIGLCGDAKYGGLHAPKTLSMAIGEMLFAGNSSFALYPELAAGAAHLICQYANEELKTHYLPKLYSGEWSATMCLTESHCGSDLGLLKAKAIADSHKNGLYKITGEKIFISGGEHDLTDNIVHLVLARLPEAPAGIKGISLFLVPKHITIGTSKAQENTGVQCTGIEDKMGIKAAATCVMNFEEAMGYLVGEPHKGLSAMFSMMNFERLSISMQGLGLGTASYQTALAYAKERVQGKSVHHPEKGSVPILMHDDVKRMLLTMKAMNEGSRTFALYTAGYFDQASYANSPKKRQLALSRLSLLTPVVKAFITDMGFDTCVLGQQILGGHGYIREWGQEQHVRDARIAQIYEGTNGIQAIDLLSRKIIADKGQSFYSYTDEMKTFINHCCKEHDNTKHKSTQSISQMASLLNNGLALLISITTDFVNNPDGANLSANGLSMEYLHLFGYVSYGYMWLKSANTAEKMLVQSSDQDKAFLSSKINTAWFYFHKLLPRTETLMKSLQAGSSIMTNFPEEEF